MASAKTYGNLIGGKFVPAKSGKTFENLSPADTSDVVGVFASSEAADVDAAVQAAAKAYETWRLVPAPKRAEILYRTGELLLKRKEEFARDMTREMGKVLSETRGDVQEAIDTAYYMAGEGRRLFGQTTPSELQNKFAMSVRMPVGVCGMIAIFCTFHPMQELTTWIYFLPINIRARTLLIFLTLFSLFGTIIPLGNIAHAAHLGGILVGLTYVRWGERLLGGLSGWPGFGRRQREMAPTAARRGRPWRRTAVNVERQPPAEDFISKEVDPILEKISAQGIHALTERDRKILEAARKRMGKGGG